MTSTEQPSPDQTGAWDVDYGEVLRAHARGDDPIHDAIANYREQQRRAGVVEVNAQDLWDAITDLVDWECDVDHSPELAKIRGYAQRPEELRTTIREMLGLAAAQEQGS